LLQDDGEEANQFRSFVGTASVIEVEGDGVDSTDGAAARSIEFVAAMMVTAVVMMAWEDEDEDLGAVNRYFIPYLFENLCFERVALHFNDYGF